MEETKVKEFKEDYPLLIEAGFLAVKQLDEVSASRIFHTAQLINPSHTAPRIGLGWIALNKLEVKKATEIFEEVTAQEPENWLAQTFLGICYILTKSKRKRGEKLVKEAVEKSDDPTIKNLGEISLEWAEKDLKKEKSPLFVVQDKTEEK